jgi:hypothetical protein
MLPPTANWRTSGCTYVNSSQTVNLCNGPKSQHLYPIILEFEKDIVDGSMSIRCQKHTLPILNQRTNNVRNRSRLAGSWHPQHQSIILSYN